MKRIETLERSLRIMEMRLASISTDTDTLDERLVTVENDVETTADNLKNMRGKNGVIPQIRHDGAIEIDYQYPVTIPWRCKQVDPDMVQFAHLDQDDNPIPLIVYEGRHIKSDTATVWTAGSTFPTNGRVTVTGSGITYCYVHVDLIKNYNSGTPADLLEWHTESTLMDGDGNEEEILIAMIFHTVVGSDAKITGIVQIREGVLELPGNG